MASFFEFSQLLDKAEGGYQNSPSDKVGNSNSLGTMVGTNHGISAPIYEHFLGHPPTQTEMQQMTKEQALSIYQDKYWGMIQGDRIEHQQVANAIGDMAVNAEKPGIQLAHERLWLQGYPIDLPATNDRLGDQALQALNGMNEREAAIFVNAYTLDRANYYQNLGEKYDGNKVGWDNRLTNHFPEDKQVQGWHDAKQGGYYFTTSNIQYIIYSDGKGQVDQAKIDGVPGPGTQAALKEWQTTNNLSPTGYLDSPTNFVLNHQIMNDSTTKQIGDNNRLLGEAREIRADLHQQAKEWATPYQNVQGFQAHQSGLSAQHESGQQASDHTINHFSSGGTADHSNALDSMASVSPSSGSTPTTATNLTTGSSDAGGI